MAVSRRCRGTGGYERRKSIELTPRSEKGPQNFFSAVQEGPRKGAVPAIIPEVFLFDESGQALVVHLCLLYRCFGIRLCGSGKRGTRYGCN